MDVVRLVVVAMTIGVLAPASALTPGRMKDGIYCGDVVRTNVRSSSFTIKAWTYSTKSNPRSVRLHGNALVIHPNKSTLFVNVGDPLIGDPIPREQGQQNPGRTKIQDYIQLIGDTYMSEPAPIVIRIDKGAVSYVDGSGPVGARKASLFHGCE